MNLPEIPPRLVRNDSAPTPASVTLKARIRYDGTSFAGWQIQPGQRTLQGVIEDALARIAGRPVRIRGAGRTDAGVHALGQVFSCPWPCEPDTPRIERALSKMLGPEIRVDSVERAVPDFDARRAAKGKRYAYALAFERFPDPFTARYAWCVPWRVDVGQLGALAKTLVGMHDFAGFRCAHSSAATTIRTIETIEMLPGGVVGPVDASLLYRIEFCGNGFLYKMVRNIVGTIVDVARGLYPESRVPECLSSPGPFRGHTAPAHGLTLVDVYYE